MWPFSDRATRLLTRQAFSFCLAGCTATAVTTGPEERPGDRFEFRAEDLPGPGEGPNGVNPPEVIPRTADDQLHLPVGFEANIFAEGLSFPRWLAIAPNGDVFLTQASSPFREVDEPNRIIVLRDEDGDGVADMKSTYAEGFERPLGLIFQGGDLLVADLNGVWRLPYTDGALKAEGREQVTEPGALGSKEGHYHRIIALHPDGEYIFVTVGSASNVAEDPSPHATIQRFKLDGSEQITFAAGLRNPIGTSFYPGTNELYTVVNERDMYGDALIQIRNSATSARILWPRPRCPMCSLMRTRRLWDSFFMTANNSRRNIAATLLLRFMVLSTRRTPQDTKSCAFTLKTDGRSRGMKISPRVFGQEAPSRPFLWADPPAFLSCQTAACSSVTIGTIRFGA